MSSATLAEAGAPPADLALGAFSEHAPWLVEPGKVKWMTGIEELRAETNRQVPDLIRRRYIPPGRRVFTIGKEIGKAVVGWYTSDRQKGRQVSREGLSRRMRLAFEHLGPTFLKLGQILSAGEGIFPPELVNEFGLCRDRVPPERFPVIRATVESELGGSLADIFMSFDPVPLAAASIAQVHAAQLRTGEPVVVKVRRPYIDELIAKDLASMSWIAPLLAGRIPVTALANPSAIVELFAETIVEELDFRLEAASMLDFARVLASTGQTTLIVPRPHPVMVTKQVLVMERLDGFQWGDAKGMREAGVDTEAVLHAGLVAFLEGSILHGIFHGDLHGGNLFVRPDGRVAVMDFGITGRLDDRKRQAFIKLLVTSTSNDVKGQIEAFRELDALPEDTDIEGLIRDLRLDQPQADLTLMSAEQLALEMKDMTKALLAHGARLPKELMLFIKDMVFLDHAISILAPDLDLIGEIAKVVAYFYENYADKIATDLGIPTEAIPEIDAEAIRTALWVADPVEKLTHAEMLERRETIMKRLGGNDD